ncbi:glycosyltransferase family 4 protein [Pseudomonas sp. MUP55]|uniref:glycosyltransferase family 4 protein n=1 Tax=Pseudomonas sp. MUP55 TaxID=3087234 RepID=UPI002A5AEB85|nr:MULTISPECIES: glycosyltransferase family 4 protein [unclassified Pseudomonas]WPN94332.1 glycosyltransferase family 4 protein [Pseudomonas sp. MUP56]WPN99859.1 glycosyltransferase family 4 protein [Pseudomonas sp. MUP55]
MPASKLKILVVTQYFWPENMRINDLVRDFVERGHEVTVLTGLPNYPEGAIYEPFRNCPSEFENYSGAQVVRVPLIPRGTRSFSLILNYFSFFVAASVLGPWKLRNKKIDVVFVYAVSPIMAAIPALVIGRIKKAPVFIWVLDLWPETLRAVGVLKNTALLSLVGKLVSWIYNRADYLLLQSHGFLESVKRYCTRDMPSERLVYFPSWAEDEFSKSSFPITSLLQPDGAFFTILFAGNLGEAQDFPAIAQAVQSLQNKISIRWVFVGDGRMSQWLADEVRARELGNVLLLGRHPLEEMPALFACADALLVSLKTNDVFEKTIPGKVQAYLASGKPILGMIDGEAARVIDDSGAGLSCASGDAEALARITLELATMTSERRASMGNSGREYYLKNYSKPTLLTRLEQLFRDATLRKGRR